LYEALKFSKYIFASQPYGTPKIFAACEYLTRLILAYLDVLTSLKY